MVFVMVKTLILAGALTLVVGYNRFSNPTKGAMQQVEVIRPPPNGLHDLESESDLQATEWNQTYGGALDDFAYSVVETADGGYAIAGSTASFGAVGEDFWLVKTDAAGNMVWNKTFGGARHQYARSVIETADGGYAIFGTTEAIGPGGVDFWLVKTDSNGNVQWNQRYGGAGEDWGWSVIQTCDEGYAMVGTTQSFGPGDFDFWLVKTNSTGYMNWTQTYGGTSDDGARSVVQTSCGGYAIIGSTESSGAGDQDFWLVKTNSTGYMVWNKTYGGAYGDVGRSVVETVDGGYALAGSTFSFGAGSWDSWLVKTDSTGNMLWNKTYGRLHGDYTESMVLTSDEGFALAGCTGSYGAIDFDCWLVKVDSLGNEQWNRTYGGAGRDRVFSVVVTADAGYAVAGYTDSFGSGLADFWLIKFESTPGVHDVAVRDVMTLKTVLGAGYSVAINVTAVNQGDFTETFDVTLYANTTAICTQTVNDIHEGTSTILVFTWDTTGLIYGSYTISAVADVIPGETHASDNTSVNGVVLLTVPGDCNGDRIVDIFDIGHISAHWHPGPPVGLLGYHPNADVNGDGAVDIFDIGIVSSHWGESW